MCPPHEKTFANTSLLSILKHNIDLSIDEIQKYLEIEDLKELREMEELNEIYRSKDIKNITYLKNKYLTIVPEISDIYFKDTISFFKNLNSIFIIFFENEKKPNHNMTKKIYLSTKKHRKTKRKQLKKTLVN